MQRLLHFVTSLLEAQPAHWHSCSDTCTDDIKLVEDIPHILSSCMAYSDIRERILLEYAQLSIKSEFDFNCILSDSNRLTKFILDPTSLNLKRRISYSDTNSSENIKGPLLLSAY